MPAKFRLEPSHVAIVNALVDNEISMPTQRIPVVDVAKASGICGRTLYRYLKHPEFQECLAKAREERRRYVQDIALAAQRTRMLEYQRLYLALPDSYLDKVIEPKGPVVNQETGEIIRDSEGEPVRAIAVYRYNTEQKVAILRQIAYELGQLYVQQRVSVQVGPGGGVGVLILPPSDIGQEGGMEVTEAPESPGEPPLEIEAEVEGDD